MRILIFLLPLLLLASPAKTQDLTGKIIDQPDGITISYFNSNADTCLPRIFIGDSLKVLFSCYSKGNYQRIDITNAKTEIERLKNLLTSEFVLKINKCCGEIGNQDTNHGYFLMLKKGNKDYSQYLDISLTAADKCGSTELKEIIELLNKINKKYR